MTTATALILTARDREVLRFVGQNGLASRAHLHDQFWPEARPDSPQRRIAQLVRQGWLGRHVTDVREAGMIVYVVTPAGAAHFSRAERRDFIIGMPAAHEIGQQLDAQTVRIRLEAEYGAASWQLREWHNERVLRREQRRGQPRTSTMGGQMDDIADARAVFVHAQSGEQKSFDIEIDGAYYGTMLSRKLAHFATSATPVVWATRSRTRAARIRGLVIGTSIRVMEIG